MCHSKGRVTLALSRPLLCVTVHMVAVLIDCKALKSSHSVLPVSTGFWASGNPLYIHFPRISNTMQALFCLIRGSKVEVAVELTKMLQSFVRGVGGSRTMHGLCSPPSTRWDYSCAPHLQMHTVDTPPFINF